MATEIVRPMPEFATETTERRRAALVCALLVFAVLAIYAPVYYFDFLNYDDGDYVILNQHVNAGLTTKGLTWAFINLHGEHTYWHPLTWVSHMLDCQFFGLNPGPHHLVNVLFHIANSLLVFLLLRRITGAVGRSAVVATLFALHPLQVDTVAWITERKNLLSSLFWLLTMWAYARYAEGRRQKEECRMQNPTSNIQHPTSSFYLLALFFFVLGLMCKPALVTLPFALLLFDYWPLRRLELKTQDSRRKTLLPLLWEKLPFVALAAAASFVTVAAHQELHALNRHGLPFDWRIANAFVSYVRYLGKTFWPAHLAVFYPHPGAWPAEMVAGSGLVLLALSVLVIWRARQAPYLVTGWLWFLGVLVPMIGIMQAGDQAMADRFAYVPLIGLLMMVVWAVPDLVAPWNWGTAVLKTASVLALGACALLTSRQLPYWQNTVTLFEHALAVTPDNATAHLVLGQGLQIQGQNQRAVAEYRAAAALDLSATRANYNMGLLLQAQGKWQEAAEQYQIVVRGNSEYYYSHFYLAEVLEHLGRTKEAVFHLREALRLDPGSAEALNNLAWVLSSSRDPEIRNGAEAVRLAERACELTKYQVTMLVGTLAAAYAEAGRFAEAAATAEKACALASKAKDRALLRKNQELYELYRAGQPYREGASPSPAEGNPPASLEVGLPSRR